jgi:hypothetical protein
MHPAASSNERYGRGVGPSGECSGNPVTSSGQARSCRVRVCSGPKDVIGHGLTSPIPVGPWALGLAVGVAAARACRAVLVRFLAVIA